MVFRFYVNHPDYRQIPDKLIAGLPGVAQEKENKNWSKDKDQNLDDIPKSHSFYLTWTRNGYIKTKTLNILTTIRNSGKRARSNLYYQPNNILHKFKKNIENFF